MMPSTPSTPSSTCTQTSRTTTVPATPRDTRRSCFSTQETNRSWERTYRKGTTRTRGKITIHNRNHQIGNQQKEEKKAPSFKRDPVLEEEIREGRKEIDRGLATKIKESLPFISLRYVLTGEFPVCEPPDSAYKKAKNQYNDEATYKRLYHLAISQIISLKRIIKQKDMELQILQPIIQKEDKQ